MTDTRDAWLEIAGPGGLAPLAELVLGLNLSRLVASIFHPRTTRPAFRIPPMSEEWLRRHAADFDKHVDQI